MSQFLLSEVDPFISPNDKSQHSVKQGEFVSFQDEIYDCVLCTCAKTCEGAPTESQSCTQHAHEDARRQVFCALKVQGHEKFASLNHQTTLSS